MRRIPTSLALVLALTAALLLPARAGAQMLKLASLRVFSSDVVGPWVTYRVRSQSGRSPVRDFKQRVAIVSREQIGPTTGYWVELKTTDRTGIRIERGLFATSRPQRGENDEGPISMGSDDPGQPLKLVRYQMLAPGGKLYEYPLSSATSPRLGGGVSSYELFEFDPTVRPVRRFLGPDTLRVGRRVIPSVLEWSSRSGTDDWPVREDSTSTSYRLILTQTLWRNPAVPITGFARSLFRVSTKAVPPPTDSARVVMIPPDSTLTFAPADTTLGATTMQPGPGHVLSWTELVLQDLGADAVAEVTQTPEPAPASERGTDPTNIR
jgi:hypothetical protein